MTKDIKHNDPYKNAGVDINAGNDLIDKIKNDVVESHSPNVIGNFGGFAGMFSLGKDYEDPVLVACTDGVGTKVSLAQEINSLDFIGQDLVAMCVNDLIVCGAKPLFFLDYFASSKLNVDEAAKIIFKLINKKGIINLGGESNSIYKFAKKTNPKVKKLSLKNNKYPKKLTMNLKKLNKLLKV